MTARNEILPKQEYPVVIPGLTPQVVDIIDAGRQSPLAPYTDVLSDGRACVHPDALRADRLTRLETFAPLNARKFREYMSPTHSLVFEAYQHAMAPLRAARFAWLEQAAQTRKPEDIPWGNYYYDPGYQQASRKFTDNIAILARHIAIAHLSQRIGFPLTEKLIPHLAPILRGAAENFDTPVSPDPMEQELFIDGTGGGLTYSAYVIFDVLFSLHEPILWNTKSPVPRRIIKELQSCKDELFGDYTALASVVFTY